MIPSRQEVLYRLYGTLRLARFDPAGAQYFDESPEAALRSFFAALLVAPAHFLRYLLVPDEMMAPHEATLFTFLADVLVYTLTWTVFPVVAFHICKTIARERAFFRYLSASNWSTVVTAHLSLVMVLLAVGGILSPGIGALLILASGGYILGYAWFIARICLNISGAGAAGFVVLQIMIQFFIFGFALALLA